MRICGGGLEVVTVEGRKKIDSTVKLEVGKSKEYDEVTVESEGRNARLVLYSIVKLYPNGAEKRMSSLCESVAEGWQETEMVTVKRRRKRKCQGRSINVCSLTQWQRR